MTRESEGNSEAVLQPLELALSVEETKAELALPEPDPDAELRERDRNQDSVLLDFDASDQAGRERSRLAVEEMGRELQTRAASRTRMLQAPVRDMAHGSEDGGPV